MSPLAVLRLSRCQDRNFGRGRHSREVRHARCAGNSPEPPPYSTYCLPTRQPKTSLEEVARFHFHPKPLATELMDFSIMPTVAAVLLALSALLLPVALAAGCQRDEAAEPAGDGPTERANRLADESSRYLLLHAGDPVDWYAWGPEAFAKARQENKLVFLSIGYSSCHWCHVMHHESFSDEEVARALNQDFVCIKVDREERPDIDEIYMTAVQIYFQLVGSPQGGGWPLTALLTPEGKPFAGGTYFPPRDRGAHTGLLTLLAAVQKAWKDDPKRVAENADAVSLLVRRQLEQQPQGDVALGPELIDGAVAELAQQFDPQFGGFGYSATNPQYPKFPTPSSLFLLLDRAARAEHDAEGAAEARRMLFTTLDRMAAGGIRDHLGGGFHRYSTDRFWAIPHFEKMLYDNGQLASVYAEAYAISGRENYRRVAAELLDFVLREMTGPDGRFHSSIDADTDGHEGLYYLWKYDELAASLAADELPFFADVYDVHPEGNFEGRNVILLRRPLAETTSKHDLDEQQLAERLAPLCGKLLEVRYRRERPAIDTKVLAAWSALMIRGFADAGRIFNEPRYVETAQRAARFVLDNLRLEDGRLLRSPRRKGAPPAPAYLDDYAFLVDALLALQRATGERAWIEEADRLTARQLDLFWDDARGGFFFTADDHETLLARSKSPADSVLPSGQAVSVSNLVRLGRILDRAEYLDRARETAEAFAPLLQSMPGSMTYMAVSLGELLAATE